MRRSPPATVRRHGFDLASGEACLAGGGPARRLLVVACVALPDLESPPRGYVGATTEYLRTGSAPPPAAYEYPEEVPRPVSVPTYESWPLHGARIRATVSFYTDASCEQHHEKTFELVVP
ncbi:MAG: hypothetical protein FJ104_17395 [Deltaproteobacteria bacterium]|nr:hypothetical protein [Deltaproteobacteria bacterium]